MIGFDKISFAASHNAFLFLGVFCALFVLSYRLKKVVHAIQILTGTWSRLIFHFSLKKQIIKIALVLFGLTSLIFALLRPQWHEQEETIAQKGRDVFIALDVSKSMLATDCVPNRLTCAKQKIKSLLKKLLCERVGLILFSGSAFVQCPLTNDFASFYLFLDQVDVETISSGTTALDSALKQAITSFQAFPEKKNKLLVLITDGEDFSSNLYNFKQQAQKDGLHIFALGMGTTQGSPIPVYDDHGNQSGHLKDDKDNVVITRLNEGILQTLTRDVGGMYIPFSNNNDDIQTIVKKISSFEKEDFGGKKVKQFEDKYHYFLVAGFLCLALEWLL